MGRYADSLSPKHITFMGTRYIHDTIADAEGELPLKVHQGGYGKVGQSKQGTSLTNVSTIQVVGGHRHLSYGMLRIDLGYLASSIPGKTIVAIEYFLYVHYG
jgi:hypothetical protein